MQVLNVEDFEKRVIYKQVKAYGNQLNVGQGNRKLKPFVGLTITDFVLFEDCEEIITKFRLKEEKKLFNYRDELTLMFLELPKFKKELSDLETKTEKCIYFMKSAQGLEVIPSSLEEESEIKAALNIANRANLNNEELEEIQKEEILIEDRKGEISLAIREGIGIGREEGIGIGREEGIGIGREEGLGIGREEGLGMGVVKQILRQIRRKFGEITPEVQTQIEQLSLEKLDILGEEIFDLATLVDLENWLNQQLN
jgi:predicted transposase/invertase (TIGR01784 family)